MILYPSRASKPRSTGLTMLLDKGLDIRTFEGIINDWHEYIDIIKFGWCTALLSKSFERKVGLCKNFQIEPMLGGTFFEYCSLTHQLNSFYEYLDRYEIKSVEISNGSGQLDFSSLLTSISIFSSDRQVFHEVGLKSSSLSLQMSPMSWVTQIQEGRSAGAHMTILETRESGRSGICSESGSLREDLCDIIVTEFDIRSIIFEAPSSTLQSLLITRYGSDTNLGNISFADILGLETLRLGLRFDTLTQFTDFELPPQLKS